MGVTSQDFLVSGRLAPHWPDPGNMGNTARRTQPSLGTDPSLVLPFGAALPATRRPASRPAQFSICSLFQALDLK